MEPASDLTPSPRSADSAPLSQRRSSAPSRGDLPSALPERRRWIAFASLMLGLFTMLAAATSVSTAIPAIKTDLHAGLSQVEWLVDSYVITLTVFLTTFGRFGDLFGRKRMFLLGSGLFILGSAACGFARDMNYLIAFRAFTGLGPAMMMPATLSLITDLFPAQERGLPMGIWGGMVGVAVAAGPIMGGLLVSDVDWQWVFWSGVLLGVVAAGLGALLLPPSRRGRDRPDLDVPGIVLNGGFVFSLSYALVEGHNRGWSSPLILSLFVASAVLLALFVLRELKARQPMLDLTLFCRAAFSAGVLVTVTISFALLSIFVLLPLFLQGPRQDSALASGLTLLPMSACIAIAGPFGGLLASRVQPRWPIVLAMCMVTAGIFWLAHLTVSTTWQWLAFPFIGIGIGLGISSANINTAVMLAVPREVAGAAAGVIATSRQLGSVLGVAVLGAVLQNRQDLYLATYLRTAHTAAERLASENRAFTDALNDALLVCAAVLAVGTLAALLIQHRPEERSTLTTEPSNAAQ